LIATLLSYRLVDVCIFVLSRTEILVTPLVDARARHRIMSKQVRASQRESSKEMVLRLLRRRRVLARRIEWLFLLACLLAPCDL
jgi:hypothetical protein